jgi:bifunctional DNA-binding transcriptional regulator/antitoxin component of YhaV-PrlF toxin-antitoxin module
MESLSKLKFEAYQRTYKAYRYLGYRSYFNSKTQRLMSQMCAFILSKDLIKDLGWQDKDRLEILVENNKGQIFKDKGGQFSVLISSYGDGKITLPYFEGITPKIEKIVSLDKSMEIRSLGSQKAIIFNFGDING